MAKKMGRPSVLNDKIREIALNLAKEGKTNKEIAKVLGISRRTFDYWLGGDKDFLRTIKESKDMADGLVEASLYHRAKGYSVVEEKIFCTKDGEIVRAKTIKHYPPSEVAQIFWLKNRQPDRWREKPDAGDVETPIKLDFDDQKL